jgi:threonine aldolase
LLIGDKVFIQKARKVRKVFGGGMRQAGFLAAAGLYALQHHVKRLGEDHQRAKALENTLKQMPYVESILPVYTNIVIFNLKANISGETFERTLAEAGIKISAFGKQTIRMVTHLDYTDDMLHQTIEVLTKLSKQ